MTSPIASEAMFSSFDGTELFYRAWLPPRHVDKALFIFHRGHEHSGRVQELVQKLSLEDFAIFAWDQRGHGRSPGDRGYADSLSVFVRDIDSFVRHATAVHGIPIENVVVLGHSVAGVLVTQWVHDYAPRVRAMILATPAFRVKLYMPFALTGLRIWQWAARRFEWQTPFIRSYVRGKHLTHDKHEAEQYDNDPLISKQIAVNILIDLFESSRRMLADAGAIVTPTLLLSARADWVVKNEPQRRFFERISTTVRNVAVYRGFYHSIFHESERDRPVADVRAFIERAFRHPVDRTSLVEADKTGFTYEEYQWLSAGLPMLSPKRWIYAAQRFLMRKLGTTSDGVAIGWRHGFDSGQSLDYVYRNRPSGTGSVGRLIDQAYLDSVGWKGIRMRKVHLEELLRDSVGVLAAEREADAGPLRLADIAGGPGRYLIDFVRSLEGTPVDVTVRDWSITALEEGRLAAESYGLSSIRYEHGDAFDTESVASLGPLDIGIVSGLYELFPENGRVLASLRGLAQAIRSGGYLLYTNQPWHPQLEMIREVLMNRNGDPWIMRRRTQAEMDELVRTAGFEKLTMRIDPYGIFTVSLARKLSA